MDLMGLFNQVRQAIYDDPSTPHREGYDPSGLMGQLQNIFGQHQQQMNQGQVVPASQDPYGDPANQAGGQNYAYADRGQFGNVRPASEDPLGDPADQQQFGNVRPASEDPLGDPADGR